MNENNKFVVGEDEAAKPTEATEASSSAITAAPTITTQYKRPVRHHVKRRSSGRVHVAKLAPMARVNSSTHVDTEADYIDEPSTTTDYTRPTIKRSQSQRSLHKMSVDRKGFGILTTARRKSTASTDKISVSEMPKESSNKAQANKAISSNPASLSSSNIAAPVEITFNAIANNLVIPKKELLPKIASPLKASCLNHNTATADTATITTAVAAAAASEANNLTNTQQRQRKKQLLRSQFVTSSYEEAPTPFSPYKRLAPTGSTSVVSTPVNRNRPNSSTATNNPNNMSRTQQKLLLQKQQALVEDENSPMHPRNMHKLNKEFDMVGREYKCIKRYEDPMRVSLMRCVDKLDSQKIAVNPQLARLQSTTTFTHGVGAPTSLASLNRHHHLKSVALSGKNGLHKRQLQHHQQQQSISPNTYSTSNNIGHNHSKQASNRNVFTSFPWSATAFIDRIFSNTPH